MVLVSRARMCVLLAVGMVMMGNARGQAEEPKRVRLVPASSPVAEPVKALLDGWRRAENYVKTHLGCEVFVGRGDSMLPFYRDGTVLVVRTVTMNELGPGMTVIFTGDTGALVAHTLLENTATGWRAMGVGNREADCTRVNRVNLVGVVVKAYAPPLPGRTVAAQ